MTRRLKVLLLLCSLLAFLPVGKAQPFSPIVRNYGPSDYYAARQNWSVSQDGEGMVFVGNGSTLLTFDNHTWRHHSLPRAGIVRSVTFGRLDEGGDIVETSYLFMCLLCARAYFDGDSPLESYLRDKITQMWETVNWAWYERDGLLFWHWCPNQGFDMNFPVRGWISGSAKSYYDEAIRANFDFMKKYYKSFTFQGTTYDPTHGVPITDEYVAAYLAAPSVTAYATSGSQTDRLHQIWMQSYLASFFHLAYDEYFNYRRTGYPEWPVNPDSNLNDGDPTKIPSRWLYPTDEYNYNDENRVAAVAAQGWGAAESVNDVMWVIK